MYVTVKRMCVTLSVTARRHLAVMSACENDYEAGIGIIYIYTHCFVESVKPTAQALKKLQVRRKFGVQSF